MPITSPRDPVTLLGSVTAWLPPGVWTDIHTGVVLEGERTIELHRGPDSIPVLLRCGGILPLAGEDETDAAANPAHLELVVAPGADGSFTLVEDDGSVAGAVACTTIRWNQDRGELVIEPVDGPDDIVPAVRTWKVTFLGLGAEDVADAEVSARGASVTVTGDVRSTLVVSTTPDPASATRGREERLFALMNTAQYFYEDKAKVWRIITSGRSEVDVFADLHALGLPPALMGALAEQFAAR